MEENLIFNRMTYFYIFFAFHGSFVKLEPFCKIHIQRNGQLWTNCSHKKFSSVSRNISVSTTRLILSYNVMKRIKPGNFQNFKNLTYLDISNNSLKTLDPASFIGLTKLRVLNISGNDLSNKTSFPKGVFKPFSSSLLELDMRHNLMDRRTTLRMYPDETLADLYSLKVLKIDCISGEYLHNNNNNLFESRITFTI